MADITHHQHKERRFYRVVGVVAAAAELVPALGAAEVHAATFSQSILEPAVGTGWDKTTQKLLVHTQTCNVIMRV